MSTVNFTLRQLEYFIVIAESSTLSDAAEKLRLSQSALSQALTELENSLGAQLCIRRRSRGIALTPTGGETLLRARHLVREALDMQWEGGRDTTLRGPLSVGCYTSLAPGVLPAILEGFGLQHPDVDITIFERTQDVLQSEMLNGSIDIALLYDMSLAGGLVTHALQQIEPHLLVHQKHPLASRGHVRLADLIDEPMVLLDSPPSAENTLAVYRAAGLSPRVAHRPRSFETARSLVGRGLGYSFLVQRPANSKTYDGRRVVRLEIDDDVPLATLMLAVSARTRPNARARAFADHCRTFFGQAPDAD